MALVKAGADVRCNCNDGYGSALGLPPSLFGLSHCGAAGLSSRVGAAGVAGLAVQEHGAARCVVQRPHGDGDGAGQGGRRRALQGHRRVQFLGLHPRVVGMSQCGADGPSTRRCGAAGSRCVRCAGGRRCTMRRTTATRRRRWRWSRRARTCAATTTTGTVQPSGCILVSLVCRSAGAAGPSNRVWLQEWLFWLCSRTALHVASDTGHPETAMALVKAGADVHCKDKYGYGSALGLHSRVVGSPQCRGGRSFVQGWSCRSGWLGCAGKRRCTMRRTTATRRRQWRWWRRARTCAVRTTTGTVQPSGCILVSLGCRSARAADPSTRECGAAGVAASAAQGYGAALCVIHWPYGDGNGAGGGGRGRAL
jgi:hypothetical protein